LVEQRVGVPGVDVGIPASPFMPRVVWTWKHVGKDSLEHDADPVPAHAAIVDIVGWTLEVQLEAESLDVVGDRGLQVFHDEERTDGSEVFRCFGAGVHALELPSGAGLRLTAPASRCTSRSSPWRR